MKTKATPVFNINYLSVLDDQNYLTYWSTHHGLSQISHIFNGSNVTNTPYLHVRKRMNFWAMFYVQTPALYTDWCESMHECLEKLSQKSPKTVTIPWRTLTMIQYSYTKWFIDGIINSFHVETAWTLDIRKQFKIIFILLFSNEQRHPLWVNQTIIQHSLFSLLRNHSFFLTHGKWQ